MKNPLTPAGTEQATFRFVAQRLNHCATAPPPPILQTRLKMCSYVAITFQFTVIPYSSVSQTFLIANPFWFRKITTDPHILAHVTIVCPDDGYPKSKIYISELTLDKP